MEEQVVIEFMNLLGTNSLEFTDLKVKMSPHSYPQHIKRVIMDNRTVMVEVDEGLKNYSALSLPVKQTIGQRLRLMYNTTKGQ